MLYPIYDTGNEYINFNRYIYVIEIKGSVCKYKISF